MDKPQTIRQVADNRADCEPFKQVVRPLSLSWLRLNLPPAVAEAP